MERTKTKAPNRPVNRLKEELRVYNYALQGFVEDIESAREPSANLIDAMPSLKIIDSNCDKEGTK